MPYLHIPTLQLGPIAFHIFGLITLFAVILGVRATRLRAAELGLDLGVIDRLMPRLCIGVLLGAHLVSVVLYFPHRLVREPLLLLKLWDGLSSYGGIIGGLIVAILFLRRLGLTTRHYRQALLFGAVVSLMVGRFGCSLAHDHPGKETSAPFAVKGWPTAETPERGLGWYTEGPRRHDLGLYEFLFLLPLAGILYGLRRMRPFEDIHLVLVLLLYTPVRFLLDELRDFEKRYWGWTPGQYFSICFFLLGVFLAWRGLSSLRSGPPPDPPQGVPSP